MNTSSSMGRIVRLDLKNWNDVPRLSVALSMYAFRGQGNSEWSMTSSIERLMAGGIPEVFPSLIETVEYWMLHEFKKRYHLYSGYSERPDSTFDWLSIMQHHGSPTRLLDFTSSLYIAIFFALIDSSVDSAVWCINRKQLQTGTLAHLDDKYDIYDSMKDIINFHHMHHINSSVCVRPKPENPISFVLEVEPRFANQRLSLQQGLFLVPNNIKAGFETNLLGTFSVDAPLFMNPQPVDISDLESSHNEFKAKFPTDKWENVMPNIVKIHIPYLSKRHFMREITRMNLTYESLFPGVDGLARSVRQRAVWGG